MTHGGLNTPARAAGFELQVSKRPEPNSWELSDNCPRPRARPARPSRPYMSGPQQSPGPKSLGPRRVARLRRSSPCPYPEYCVSAAPCRHPFRTATRRAGNCDMGSREIFCATSRYVVSIVPVYSPRSYSQPGSGKCQSLRWRTEQTRPATGMVCGSGHQPWRCPGDQKSWLRISLARRQISRP